MNPGRTKKLLVVAACLAAALLLFQWQPNWTAGWMVGAAVAWTSCRLIEQAVRSSFDAAVQGKRPRRRSILFLLGFFGRFVLFAAVLYLAIVRAGVSPVAIVIGFTVVQLSYPIYRVRRFEKRDQHA